MNAGPEDIALAIALLQRGLPIAFPTETVYGLGADALDADAVSRVFELKGRPSTNPLIVHVSGIEMARTVAADWPEDADSLARALWPGPLTLVLPRADAVPGIVTAGGDTVAVRCPEHPLTLALLEAFGRPLVGPSANRSGGVSPTTAEHVRADFGDTLFILDGGPCTRGLESTVLSLVDEPPRILRRGVITPEELHPVLGRAAEVGDAHPADTARPARSPGLIGPHYRPRSPLHVLTRRELERCVESGRRDEPAALLITTADLEELHLPPHWSTLIMPEDAVGYAARLYAAMREADAPGTSRILVVLPPGPDPAERGVWDAVRERLSRASSPLDAPL
ncbi:MAG: L-threonylcarbamoyladenylate synthase [Phycisphaerales bacterium JB037]